MKLLSIASIRENILTDIFRLLLVGLSVVLFFGLNDDGIVYAADEFKASADVDKDGTVNIRDLTLVAKQFGETIAPNQGVPNPDVDKDGSVNIRDLTLVAKYFGQTVEHPPTFDKPIRVTDATFTEQVLNSELPIVVEFGAPW